MRYECERVRTLVRDVIKRFLREEQHFESKFSIDAFIGVDVTGMGMFYVTLKEAFDAETCPAGQSPGTSGRSERSSRKRPHYVCSDDADAFSVFEGLGRKIRNSRLQTHLESDHADGPELTDVPPDQPVQGATIAQEFTDVGQRPECTESNSNSNASSLENIDHLENVTDELAQTDAKSEVERKSCDSDSSDSNSEGEPNLSADKPNQQSVEASMNDSTVAHAPTRQFWSDSLSGEIKQALIPPDHISNASGTCQRSDCRARGNFQTSMRRHWDEVHAPYFRARQCPMASCRQWLSRDFRRHLTKVHKLFSRDVTELLSRGLAERWFTRQAWDTMKATRRRMTQSGIELTDEMIISEIVKSRTYTPPPAWPAARTDRS